jgi:late competence protein required for DNA uptake (superfamily II DNA/RNA helicase)
MSNESLKCSICKNVDAVNESVYNPGTFYCTSCANYVAMEYGMNYLKGLPDETKTSNN